MAEPATARADGTAGSKSSSGSAAKSGDKAASKNKNKKMPPLRLARLRCEHDEAAWLIDLGVLWRPTPKPADKDEPEQKDADKAEANPFNISITDERGYLTPYGVENSQDWIKSHPMLADVEYQFYFVRHPDRKLLLETAEKIAAGEHPYGDPHPITAAIEDTDPSKKGKLEELVIVVPEEEKLFIPQGSEDAFGKWVLYANMPHASCSKVRKQVKKLQEWLGAIRYIVGEAVCPYRPVPEPEVKKKEKTPPLRPMQIEGLFSPYVLNGVLGFQRNVNKGQAAQLRPGLHAEWLGAKAKTPAEETLADEYRSFVMAPESDVKPDAPLPEDAVVNEETGDALKKWIDSDLRRPGPVLVVAEGPSYWLREEGADAFKKWQEDAQDCGMLSSLRITLFHTYRPCEIDVTGAGFGRAQFSIHKTALAMDLASVKFQGQVKGFPVYRVRNDVGDRTRWLLYIAAEKKTVPDKLAKELAAKSVAGDPALYEQSIEAWKWEGESEEGGSKVTAPALPAGQAYLNLTKLAQNAGLTNISAFKEHWYAILGEDIKYGSPATFDKLVSRLVAHSKWADKKPFHKVKQPAPVTGIAKWLSWEEPELPAVTELTITSGDVTAEVARLKWWSKLAGGLAPTPTVKIDPSLEEHRKFLKKLKGQKASARQPLLLDDGVNPPSEITPDASTVFPKTAFRLTPKLEALFLPADQVFRFPRIEGEAIGQEWWHYELKDKKGWMDLMYAIGWTKEGLMNTPQPALYGRSGIGYRPDQVPE
jgi:hypothetical protein